MMIQNKKVKETEMIAVNGSQFSLNTLKKMAYLYTSILLIPLITLPYYYHHHHHNKIRKYGRDKQI